MNSNIKKPNFFIAGAPRCGTTTLYHLLGKHPNIFMSPIKMPRFFGEKESRIKGKQQYLSLFKEAEGEEVRGEATPDYLYSYSAPKEIKSWTLKPKALIQLRNPVERALSHYRFLKRNGVESRPLEKILKREDIENLKFLNQSFYSTHLKRWSQNLGGKNVKVTIFKDFIENPKRITKEIHSFLGIEPRAPKEVKRYNPGGKPYLLWLNKFIGSKDSRLKAVIQKILPKSTRRTIGKKIRQKYNLSNKKISVSLSEKTKKRLQEYFKEDINQIEKLIGRDLSFWKKYESKSKT